MEFELELYCGHYYQLKIGVGGLNQELKASKPKCVNSFSHRLGGLILFMIIFIMNDEPGVSK